MKNFNLKAGFSSYEDLNKGKMIDINSYFHIINLIQLLTKNLAK